MSLRLRALFWDVICNGDDCTAVLETTKTNGILAFYEATLKHDWVAHSGIPLEVRKGRLGVFCPDCQDAMYAQAKEAS